MRVDQAAVNYILTFQAGLLANEVDFEQKPEEDEPEPLRMEHFYLALIILGVGLVLSACIFMAEIIIKRLGQRERDRENHGL